MEISIKSMVMLGAVLLTGLSAGLFYAWSVSVIPGTQKVAHQTYLETMQSINRAILNPYFFAVFFGSIILLGMATVYEFHGNKTVFWLLLVASISYLAGTIGVTGLGNVPLNNQLDVVDLTQMELSKLQDFRQFYEKNWNRLHQIRTGFAVLAFLLALMAVMVGSNKP